MFLQKGEIGFKRADLITAAVILLGPVKAVLTNLQSRLYKLSSIGTDSESNATTSLCVCLGTPQMHLSPLLQAVAMLSK